MCRAIRLQGYTPEKVYALFIRNLESRSLRRHYFDEHKLADRLVPNHGLGIDVDQIFEESFNKVLSVSRDKQNKVRVRVSFEGPDAGLAAQWVNDIVTEANKATVRTLVADVASKLESARRELREEIAAKRKLAKQRRLDRISQLEEAIHIAAELEPKKPSQTTGKAAVALAQTGMPLYMMGVRVLRAELESLQVRKNDTPFIKGLRDLEEKLTRLESAHVDASRVSAVFVDQPAVPPIQHIKPRRKLVVLLALFGGLFLGVLAAFFADFLGKVRREQLSETVV